MARTATRERNDQEQAAPRSAPTDNLPAAQPAKAPHPLVRFREYATKRLDTLRELPHIDPQQLLSVALTAIQRKPDLMRCTPQSLWNSCVLAAQDGLLPDGREGAIVPYGENENGKRVAEIATWMPMVEGLRKKVRNSGKIKDWYVEVVYAGDYFRYRKGDDPRLEHEPVPPSQRTPGMPFQGIIAAYSIAVLVDGTKTAPEVMWIEEIEQVRQKSKAKNGPWQDQAFYPEMCKKVVARRHYKQLPKAPGLDRLIQRDDRDYDLDRQDEVLIEQRQARRLASVTSSFDAFAAESADQQQDDTAPVDGDEFAADNAFDDAGVVEGELIEPEPEPEKPAAPQRSAPRPAEQTRQRAAAPPREERRPPPPADEPPPAATQPEASADAGIDADANFWPEGQVPADEDEYTHYAETRISQWTTKTEYDTGTTTILGADGISAWWKSEAERKLRSACGVQKPAFDDLQAKAKARAEALRKGAA